MSPVGFEPTISVGERPQTYALDRAATGTGWDSIPDRPARSQSLYRLSYRAHHNKLYTGANCIGQSILLS